MEGTRRERQCAMFFGISVVASFSIHGQVDAAFTLHQASLTHNFRLFAAPERRQPRRNLKKIRKRKNHRDREQPNEPDIWANAELRPLVLAEAQEAGQDYWMDEKELQQSLQREQAIKNRKAMEGEIPQEKLRAEVVAPYKQNWIGLFSVGIVTLATIVTQFPELLNQPVIQIPDL